MALPPKEQTARWLRNANPILAQGQIGNETDTGRTKVGDGVSPWSALSYVGTDLVDDAAAIADLQSSVESEESARTNADLDHVNSGNPHPQYETVVASQNKVNAEALLRERAIATKAVVARRDHVRIGPISNDFTAVTINGTVDTTTYNKTYALTTLASAKASPIEFANCIQCSVAGYDVGRVGSNNSVTRTIRFVLDGDKFAFYTGFSVNLGVMIYVDGRPTSLTPYALSNSNYWNTVTFPSAKPRLIELQTAAGLLGIYTSNPYTVSKPSPVNGPRVYVLGDSYVQGVGSTLTVNGVYHNIGPYLGTEQVWVDGVGGTGYGVTSDAGGVIGGNRYLDRINPVTLAGTTELSDIEVIKPDLFVVHGGGINDLYKGRTVAQVVADAVALFTQARTKLPKAKLVFVEGFAPPAFTPATYNPNYITIRQQVQAALTSIGVYYVDVATTDPWIKGTGRVGATTGAGNSDVYIGADSAHPVDAGHIYIRVRMAERLRRILQDDGTLLNTLI